MKITQKTRKRIFRAAAITFLVLGPTALVALVVFVILAIQVMLADD